MRLRRCCSGADAPPATTAEAFPDVMAGTTGTWFLLDCAYYGNTISTPQILSLISPHASP